MFTQKNMEFIMLCKAMNALARGEWISTNALGDSISTNALGDSISTNALGDSISTNALHSKYLYIFMVKDMS